MGARGKGVADLEHGLAKVFVSVGDSVFASIEIVDDALRCSVFSYDELGYQWTSSTHGCDGHLTRALVRREVVRAAKVVALIACGFKMRDAKDLARSLKPRMAKVAHDLCDDYGVDE